MDIAELVLLLVVLSSAFAVIYVLYTTWMNWNAKKVTSEIKTSRVATVFMLALGLLAISNALSSEWVSGLNAIIWLLAIGPVVACVYLVLHVFRVFGTGKKVSAKQRQVSIGYIGIFLTILVTIIVYPLAQDWNANRNEQDYQESLRQTCQVIDDSNEADCLRRINGTRRAAEERLDSATGN